tara:strand:- start:377 stop:520 length:144 start_codon:yes stop_codon:yes gene_type:complete
MKTKEMKALPKHPNKYDSEFFELDITGKFEKSEVRHLIQRLDNLIHH